MKVTARFEAVSARDAEACLQLASELRFAVARLSERQFTVTGGTFKVSRLTQVFVRSGAVR